MSGAPKRVALVTGANRGIGLGVARQLAGGGMTVLLGSRSLERGRAAAAGLEREGVTGVRAVELDVASAASVARFAEAVRADGLRVDVLINNAAVHYDTWQRALDADLDGVVAEALATNLMGAWRLARVCVPEMVRRGWGRVVNVSSEAGSLAGMGAGPPAYQVSKAALNALTRTLAGEVAGSGVLVNAVCPGWVATEMGGAGGRPVSEGAASVVWAATLPDEGPNGGFFRDGRPLAW